MSEQICTGSRKKVNMHMFVDACISISCLNIFRKIIHKDTEKAMPMTQSSFRQKVHETMCVDTTQGVLQSQKPRA